MIWFLSLLYWFWGLAIALDVMAALLGGSNEAWNLHPRHFSERHGLFVIIALGETLIVAASAVTEEYWDGYLLLVSLLSVGITCCLWWIYFFRVKDKLERAIADRKGAHRSTVARDTFSLLHFPLLCGLIIYAFAIEEAMLHPDEVMSEAARIALSLGIFIFSTGIVLTMESNRKDSIWKVVVDIHYFRCNIWFHRITDHVVAGDSFGRINYNVCNGGNNRSSLWSLEIITHEGIAPPGQGRFLRICYQPCVPPGHHRSLHHRSLIFTCRDTSYTSSHSRRDMDHCAQP